MPNEKRAKQRCQTQGCLDTKENWKMNMGILGISCMGMSFKNRFTIEIVTWLAVVHHCSGGSALIFVPGVRLGFESPGNDFFPLFTLHIRGPLISCEKWVALLERVVRHKENEDLNYCEINQIYNHVSLKTFSLKKKKKKLSVLSAPSLSHLESQDTFSFHRIYNNNDNNKWKLAPGGVIAVCRWQSLPPNLEHLPPNLVYT